MAAQLPTPPEEAALSLTLAVVKSSLGPVLLLDGDLAVIAASDTFCQAFGIDEASIAGQHLSDWGAGEWADPKLLSLLAATASGAPALHAYEMDLVTPAGATRQLVIHAQLLRYLDLENVRLLVAVSDVTEARADAKAKEEALQRNVVLLQDVRHRVANSLQIVASVLLQNAKKTSSDETRGHLRDAHHRVMSVAALERQLAGSGDPAVEVRTYFAELCRSIGAAMIADSDRISLVVTGAGGVVSARVSVSLGLIVTELVINAVKYAFPDGRRGNVTVDYEAHGPNWTLSVTDNGVGLPSASTDVRVGLGTSIVQALAKQLMAVVETGPASPGTRVAIVHTQIALVAADPKPGPGEPRTECPAAQA